MPGYTSIKFTPEDISREFEERKLEAAEAQGKAQYKILDGDNPVLFKLDNVFFPKGMTIADNSAFATAVMDLDAQQSFRQLELEVGKAMKRVKEMRKHKELYVTEMTKDNDEDCSLLLSVPVTYDENGEPLPQVQCYGADKQPLEESVSQLCTVHRDPSPAAPTTKFTATVVCRLGKVLTKDVPVIKVKLDLIQLQDISFGSKKRKARVLTNDFIE